MRSNRAAAFLRDAIVLHKKLLKLVDDEQGPGQRRRGRRLPKTGQILSARLAEEVAAALELFVDPFQHAEPKLAVALDRDDARMRQSRGRVAFEFNAFLKVDQVELHLVRAVPEREIGDGDVEERGFSGSGFSGDERVLTRAAAEGELLKFRSPHAADRHPGLGVRRASPDLLFLRRHAGEGHFDPLSVRRPLTHAF